MRNAIKMRRVALEYEGKRALDCIDWTVRRGESWALVGPNGAGKTSIVRLVNGYSWPSEGSVEVLGMKFGEVDLRDLRRRVGTVSSMMESWVRESARVLDLVVAGKYGSTRLWAKADDGERSRALSLLRVLGCEEQAEKKMRELSQGERQRVMIARTLMADAQLLILDEPCEGLDLPAREKFLKGLSRLAEERLATLVYVTHRTDEIPRGFTHALLLRGGRAVAAGPIEKTLTARNLSACFETKVRVEMMAGRYYTLVEE